MVPRQQCAFIQYTQRNAAEAAAERTFNKLILGERCSTIKFNQNTKYELSIIYINYFHRVLLQVEGG